MEVFGVLLILVITAMALFVADQMVGLIKKTTYRPIEFYKLTKSSSLVLDIGLDDDEVVEVKTDNLVA